MVVEVKLVVELFVMEVRWEWYLISVVVAFAEEVGDLETVCLGAVGVAVVVEEKIAVVEALPVVDAAHTAVAVPETAAVLATADAVRDVASEGLYELLPPRPPAVPDGVAAPAGAEAAAELL